jgi:hypothetical protein
MLTAGRGFVASLVSAPRRDGFRSLFHKATSEVVGVRPKWGISSSWENATFNVGSKATSCVWAAVRLHRFGSAGGRKVVLGRTRVREGGRGLALALQ